MLFALLCQPTSTFHHSRKITETDEPKLPIIRNGPSSLSFCNKKHPSFWNAKIRGYVDRNLHEEALLVYRQMLDGGVEPDLYTFPVVLKACSDILALGEGKQIHAHIIKNFSLAGNVFVHNGLLHLYCTAGCLDTALQVFVRMTHRNLVSWNTMISGYSRTYSRNSISEVKNGNEIDAMSLYCVMLDEGIPADHFTFTALIRACSFLLSLDEGVQIHGHVVKLGFESDVFVRNTLINMYAKSGEIQNACLLFDEFHGRDLVSYNALMTGFVKLGDIDSAEALFAEMDEHDIVSCNAMMASYLQKGQANEALDTFRQMQILDVCPNAVSVVTAISACSLLGALSLGIWFHVYSLKQGYGSNEYLNAALVKMYAKCGDIENAARFFEKITQRDVVCYDVMIEALAMHGRGKDALDLFTKMKIEGITPDEITFIGVLGACSHAGLLEEGFKHFDSMTKEYGIQPKVEHYACMVDLLGRAGRLHEALEMVESMPITPDSAVWSALLSGSRVHGNVELTEQVISKRLVVEPDNAANYVLLSNVYAAKGKWEDVANVRRLMKMKGLDKEPGCSVLEMGGSIHEFFAGDSSHPQLDKIIEKLDQLMSRLKEAGYEPIKDAVLRDMEEEVKENALYLHSEKLAVAFALISGVPGTTIRIAKNLRICSDCHSALKLISKIEDREIIMRDRNRFHHFKGGYCSCGDYW